MSNSDADHVVKVVPFGYDMAKGVMDEETYKWHHDTHYAGYVNKRNEIESELKKVDVGIANANYSAYRALKLEETWNANGELLHELYWDSMGGDGNADGELNIVKKIIADFGSFDMWKNDFIACGKAGRGWAVLAMDTLTDKKLRNVLFDLHNIGGVVGSTPVVVLDLYEHAYYHKFGPDRASYINAFIGSIDWKKAEGRFLGCKL